MAPANRRVVIALVHVMLPFMVIPIWTSLQKLDPAVEAAALTLGASPFTALRRVVMPQVTMGMLSGSLIVFGLSASSFAIPGLLLAAALTTSLPAAAAQPKMEAALATLEQALFAADVLGYVAAEEQSA